VVELIWAGAALELERCAATAVHSPTVGDVAGGARRVEVP
jgi:hypothetical protein